MSSRIRWSQPSAGLWAGAAIFFTLGAVNTVLFFLKLGVGERPYLGFALGAAIGLSVAAVLAYWAANLRTPGEEHLQNQRAKLGFRQALFTGLLALVTGFAIFVALWLTAGRSLA